MTPTTPEARVIEELAREYREKGYEVEVLPSIDVPRLGRAIRPDLVARRAGHTTAVEVKTRSSSYTEDELQSHRQFVDICRNVLGWDVRLVVLPSEGSSFADFDLAVSRERITRLTDETTRLREAGFFDAALLRIRAAWEIALQRIAREVKDVDEFTSLAGLTERLFHLGEISSKTYDSIQRLRVQGNQVSHGIEATPTTDADIDEALAVTRQLLSEPAFSGAPSESQFDSA